MVVVSVVGAGSGMVEIGSWMSGEVVSWAAKSMVEIFEYLPDIGLARWSVLVVLRRRGRVGDEDDLGVVAVVSLHVPRCSW